MQQHSSYAEPETSQFPDCAADISLGLPPVYGSDSSGGALHRRVAIVSSPLFYEGLQSLLGGIHAQLLGSFDDVGKAVSAYHTIVPPDLIVVVACSDESVSDLVAHVGAARGHMPKTKWLLLGDHLSPAGLRDAMAAGIEGILLHDISGGILRCAIELVLLGQSILPNRVTNMLALANDAPAARATLAEERLPAAAERGTQLGVSQLPEGAPLGRLSERERQILECLTKGYSNKLIARRLEIADATVKVHVKALLRKMQVSNRTQAAINAPTYLGSMPAPCPIIDLSEPAQDVARVFPPRARAAAAMPG